MIGTDLKKSLLEILIKLKRAKLIAKFMNISNITTVLKKGSRIEPKNERMIYDMKYDIIDRNMSDCQMGARKKKGCRNNIFIINGLIHVKAIAYSGI